MSGSFPWVCICIMEGGHFSFLDAYANLGMIGLALIAHRHLLVRATNERFLPARATLRSVVASESHWLQPVLILTVQWWPAPISVGGLLQVRATSERFLPTRATFRDGLVNESHWLQPVLVLTSKCGRAIRYWESIVNCLRNVNNDCMILGKVWKWAHLPTNVMPVVIRWYSCGFVVELGPLPTPNTFSGC